MKNLLFGAFLFLSIGFVSCGSDDDECSASDFVGTWTRQGSEACASDPSITADQTIVIKAGSTDTTIDLDGIEVPITDCMGSALGGLVTITLDGDVLTSALGTCSWEYKK